MFKPKYKLYYLLLIIPLLFSVFLVNNKARPNLDPIEEISESSAQDNPIITEKNDENNYHRIPLAPTKLPDGDYRLPLAPLEIKEDDVILLAEQKTDK